MSLYELVKDDSWGNSSINLSCTFESHSTSHERLMSKHKADKNELLSSSAHKEMSKQEHKLTDLALCKTSAHFFPSPIRFWDGNGRNEGGRISEVFFFLLSYFFLSFSSLEVLFSSFCEAICHDVVSLFLFFLQDAHLICHHQFHDSFWSRSWKVNNSVLIEEIIFMTQISTANCKIYMWKKRKKASSWKIHRKKGRRWKNCWQFDLLRRHRNW